MTPSLFFRWGRFELDFRARTLVMGILNVTPDSFSDGGKFIDRHSAESHALRMREEGADIIDVGGLSTRPGSEPVTVEEELRRVLPVIERIAHLLDIPVSIDTYRAEVARRALDAGAAIVNDISGLRFDPAMAGVAARADVPVVVMHIKGTPRDMQRNPTYEALIPEVLDALRESIRVAEEAGVSRVMVDPGVGFGKTFDQNLEVINGLGEFAKLGRPVLVGPSRKAFIGEILGGLSADERLEGTAGAVAACVLRGAHVVRVHDVRSMARVARVCDAVMRERVRPGHI